MSTRVKGGNAPTVVRDSEKEGSVGVCDRVVSKSSCSCKIIGSKIKLKDVAKNSKCAKNTLEPVRIFTRQSPLQLVKVINSLSDRRKNDIWEMGFGSIHRWMILMK